MSRLRDRRAHARAVIPAGRLPAQLKRIDDSGAVVSFTMKIGMHGLGEPAALPLGGERVESVWS